MDKEIFDNLVKNSIGKEKKCKKDFKIRNVVMKIALPVVIGIIMASSLTGCIRLTPSSENSAISEMAEIKDNYPFNLGDVRMYERERLYELFDENGIIDYTSKYGRRDYNCSEEDYRSVRGLDESYLYAMYFGSSHEDAETLARALGYESLDDFLVKNDYVDDKGNPSVKIWGAKDALRMAEKLNSEYYSKGASK